MKITEKPRAERDEYIEHLKSENKELRNRNTELTVLMMRYQELFDKMQDQKRLLDQMLPI